MGRFLLAAAAAFLIGCGAGEAKVLRFTAIPETNTTELKRRFDPVAAYLSERTGVAVEYVPSIDYPASVQMFKNGEVHLAWLGGLTGVQARHAVEGARAVVQGKFDPTFRAYFIAHESTGLTLSSEFPLGIAGLKFTFGSRNSTSGRLMPESYILERSGKTAEEFFAEAPGYSGKHDLTAELVESGRYQAGALNFKIYDRRVKEGKTDPNVCRIIWKTPTFADYNLTARPDIDATFGAGVTEKITAAFLEMKDERLLAAFDRVAFIPAENAEFEGIRRVAEKLGMLR